MATYLEYEGVKGNVTAKGYENQIDITTTNINVTRNVTMNPGTMKNRETSPPVLSHMMLSKQADNSCTALFKESVTGSAGKKAILHHVRTGTEKVEEYFTQELDDAIISNYSISTSPEGEPTENFTLSYSKIMINYIDHNSSNKAGSPIRVGYDLEKAKPL